MNIITFLSQKGGSGKTTLSVHAAVAAEASGERVCIIDADPQESATAWANAREAQNPVVATAQAGELDATLRAAKGEGMTLTVIDAPPHAAPAASQIAKRADLVLIPVRPAAFDLAAVPAAVEIVRATKVPPRRHEWNHGCAWVKDSTTVGSTDELRSFADAAPVDMWATLLRCPHIHRSSRRIPMC